MALSFLYSLDVTGTRILHTVLVSLFFVSLLLVCFLQMLERKLNKATEAVSGLEKVP